jgi:acyl-CoA synthetase (AMP-forming)/AMP-acid ligase II/acyl carrier protein
VPDLRLILRTATEQRVTHVSGAPSTWRGLLDQPAARLRQWRTLRLGITSGEPIPPDLVWSWRRAFPSARLLNLYGLTECVRPLAFDTSRLSAEMTTVPLGDPTPNATIFVLDETGASVEDGTIGEIGVAGPCLADGYLRRPELTAERFVSIELADASTVIVFKTGDRGRLRPDGSIELIGREDNQVKIRGFRVELGDVEATLRRVDGVRDVAVVVEDRGLESARLVAYMSMRTAHQVSSEDVRAFLRRELPEYMVPAQCVIVDALPLTASGKVDRVRLSVGRRPAADQPIASPDPATAQRLARIWSDVIGMPNVAVTANFLELGGHSLQATRIAARVSDQFAVDLDMASFLSPTETVQSMADTIDRQRTFLLTLTSATSARD